MKKNLIIGAGVLAVIAVGFWLFGGFKSDTTSDILVQVTKGRFEVDIETTGELEAKNSVKVVGPSRLRNFRIYNVTVQNIVEEGTIVKKGDWIASLNRSEFVTQLKDKEIELEKASSKYIQTQLDTTLELRKSRDELINLKYGVEEKDIVLQQSKFEPPATIKQAEIELDKAKRAYIQAQESYKIKLEQNKAKMTEASAEYRKVQRELELMQSLNDAFTITAPESGMVIYARDWGGTPIKAGSQINLWDPTVATLPDLTTMISKTFVNEVDIRKVKVGQLVEIGLDAFPDKHLTGEVIKVASVGEQKPNSDAKVFLVEVQIAESDDLLKPAMTTSNRIVAEVVEEAMYLPLECLHSHNDSITYVFKKAGIGVAKQEVVVGQTNANDAVILKGLSLEDRIYLSVPTGMGNKDINLLPELAGKRNNQEGEIAEASGNTSF
ncbi:MAG: efflux RND transporter periplasmic adaptor subunit [Bacteroidota bacterium]